MPGEKTASPHHASGGTHPEHEPCLHVKWHVDALVEGRIYHGFLKQVSLHGTEIYLDLDVRNVKTIKLRLHVPPASKTTEPHLIELSGNVAFSSFDSSESLFHVAVNALEFKDDSERKYLQSRIAAFNKTK